MSVKLYIRVRLKDGTRQYCNPTFSANGKVKPFYAMVNRAPEHHPEGVYSLRYPCGGKMIWKVVGTDPQLAVTARLKKERLLEARAIGIEVPDKETTSDGSGHSLETAIIEYLKEVRASKSERTYQAYSVTLKQFADGCTKTNIEDIERSDILAFKLALTNKGNVKRTISNRLDFLKIFFNRFELKWPLLKTDRVKYTEKTVSAYSPQEIQSLMAAADRDEADLFQFLLCTGVREQEAMFATWRDVDFDGRTFHVSEKLDLGFTPKDKEEAEIPIPDSLVAQLKERRNRQPKSRLIFPHSNGTPNGHFLRILKNVAFRVGMNCGECFNKAGKCCATSPTCSRFVLHRFRKTFATMHHEAGVSARTIQRWLRHSDLETTLRYLAGADDHSEKTRAQVNSTFAALQITA
jgi:integrase